VTHGLKAEAEKGTAMSLLSVGQGEKIDCSRNGPMRDASGLVPNFIDHLHTIARDLIFGRPNIVTLRLVREYDVNNSQCQDH